MEDNEVLRARPDMISNQMQQSYNNVGRNRQNFKPSVSGVRSFKDILLNHGEAHESLVGGTDHLLNAPVLEHAVQVLVPNGASHGHTANGPCPIGPDRPPDCNPINSKSSPGDFSRPRKRPRQINESFVDIPIQNPSHPPISGGLDSLDLNFPPIVAGNNQRRRQRFQKKDVPTISSGYVDFGATLDGFGNTGNQVINAPTDEVLVDNVEIRKEIVDTIETGEFVGIFLNSFQDQIQHAIRCEGDQ
ncbi:hypothetical protein R6Q57_029778 [Mikania cordata]